MGYIVKAPMALIDRQNGTVTTVFRGGPVPNDVTKDHLKHLLAFDLVEKSDHPVTGVQPDLAGDGSDRVPIAVPEPVVEQREDENPTNGDNPAGEGDNDKPPARTANKDVWVAYAVNHGMSEDDAQAATKDQLIDQFKD